MNKEQFKGNWSILRGKIKEKFGKLTDDDLTRINGQLDQFVGVLQKRYGYNKEKIEEVLKEFHKEKIEL